MDAGGGVLMLFGGNFLAVVVVGSLVASGLVITRARVVGELVVVTSLLCWRRWFHGSWGVAGTLLAVPHGLVPLAVLGGLVTLVRWRFARRSWVGCGGLADWAGGSALSWSRRLSWRQRGLLCDYVLMKAGKVIPQSRGFLK